MIASRTCRGHGILKEADGEGRANERMKKWLRRVVPDLFLAAVVALLVTLAIQRFDEAEGVRIRSEARAAAQDGLTLDERIDVVGRSIQRSTLLQLPALVALSGIVVGLGCRNRRWAWLTAIASIVPAMVMGVAYFIDRPLPASALATAYVALAVSMAMATSALRQKVLPAPVRSE